MHTAGFKSQTHEAKGDVPVTTAQQQTPPGQKQPRWEQAHMQPPPLLMNNACPRLTLTADTPWGHEGIPPSSDNSKNKEKEKAGYKLKCKKAPIARQPIHLGVLLTDRAGGFVS